MYVTIDKLNIYYQKVGRGKDLVMLHGWGQDVSTFWPIINILKDHFTLWLIDLPGFGRSDLPKRTWYVHNFAELINKFLKKQKIIRPIVLGHSLGGRVTIKLAAKYPESVGKLILESSAGIKPKPTPIKLCGFLAAKFIKFLIPNFFNLKQKLRYQLYRSLNSDYHSAGPLKETFLNIIAEDLSQDMKNISQETLIIWGENDHTTPVSEGKKIYQLVKNSRLEVLENLGHFSHLENPNLFTYYVKNFN